MIRLHYSEAKMCLYNYFSSSVNALRNLHAYFGICFKIDDWWRIRDEKEKTLKMGSEDKALMTCVGIGYRNLNKTVL